MSMLGFWIAVGALAVLGILFLIKPVLAHMGIGYALRRKKQTAVIVAGLMIATTVIAAASVAADSSGRSYTESLLDRLYFTDVVLGSRQDGTPIEQATQFVEDARWSDLVVGSSYGWRDELVLEASATGIGGDAVVWGIDPSTFREVARWEAIEGTAPQSLAAWTGEVAIINERMAKMYGIGAGDMLGLYLAGEEVLRPNTTTFQGHFEAAGTATNPVGDDIDVHHSDDVYQFQFTRTDPFSPRDLIINVTGPSGTSIGLIVDAPNGNTYEQPPGDGGVSLVIPAADLMGWGGEPPFAVEATTPSAIDVDFRVEVLQWTEEIADEVAVDLLVGAVIEHDGSEPLEGAPAAFLPLPAMQSLMGRAGEVNIGLVDFADDADLLSLEQELELAAISTWNQGYLQNDRADIDRDRAELEEAVRATFLGFGSFSIIAGFMLIGVMMALLIEERKHILATTRAVGAQRRDLTIMHAHEGGVYSMLAGIAGLLGAFVLALALAGPMEQIFAADGADFVLVLKPATLLTSVGFGFVMTLAVIAFSAHRSTRFHIAGALKGEEHETTGARVWTFIAGGLLIALGLLMLALGLSGGSAFNSVLGPCLVALGLGPVLARGRAKNLVFSIIGAALTVYLVSSFWFVDVDENELDFLLYPLRGVLLSISLAIVAAYSSWLHAAIVAATAWMRRVGPVVEAALGHLRQRPGRAALTISMFATVLVVLTALGTLFATFEPNDLGDMGPYDVVGDTAVRIEDPAAFLADNPPASGVDPFQGASSWVATTWMPGSTRDLIYTVGDDGRRTTSAYAPLLPRISDSGIGVTPELVRDLDFKADLAPGYASQDAAWDAILRDPSKVALIEGLQFWNPDSDEDIPLEAGGRYKVWSRHVDERPEVEVVMLIKGATAAGMYANPELIEHIAINNGLDAPGTRLWVDTDDNDATVLALESGFRRAGMEATAKDQVDELEAAVGAAFQTMLSLFLSLGILIGMVSLALINGRNVLMRKPEIGALRAIGAQPGHILAMFSIEALYLGLFSIGIGFGVGLLLAYATVTSDAFATPLQIQWGTLARLYGATVVAALAAAFLPAWRASRLAPAQAVRHTE